MSLHHLGLIFLLFVLSFSETLYEVLEIDSTASEFEIKKAFRKMSIKYLMF
jgi:curved DNA-binding protein CbpA